MVKKFLLCLIMLIVPIGAGANDASKDIVGKIVTQIPQLSQYDGFEKANGGTNIIFQFYSKTDASANVTAFQDGTVLSYTVNVPSRIGMPKRLPAVTKIQAFETAINFTKTAAADIYNQLNTKIYINTYSLTSAGYNIRLTRNVNGITYPSDSVSVWIDGETGRVTRYNRIWNNSLEFFTADEIITEKDAENYFKENIGLELRYNRKISEGKVIPYLIYTPSNTGSIDAVSTKAVIQQISAPTDNYREMIALYETNTIASTAIETESGLEEGLVSGMQAQIYARSIPELNIDDSYQVQQANYYKNTNDDFLITIRYTKAKHTISVTLNAKTLDIVGFFNSELSERTSISTVSSLRLKAVTDKFLKTHMTSYFSQLSTPKINIVEGITNTCTVIYERVVDGVPFRSNSAQFLINSDGEIISMSFIWDNVEFEDLSNIISINNAYDVFFQNIGLYLVYIRTSDTTAQPVYIVNPQIPAIISAKSGAVLSYDGSPSRPRKSLNYVGLKGHYAEDIVTTLADYDIFVSEGKVLLDVPIYQKDLIVLLAAVSPDGMPIYERPGGTITDEELEMVYNNLVTKNVIGRDEISPRSYVKREDAVKFLLRTAGYKELAELEGIFKLPFEDADEITEGLYGYVSLARGLRLISGSEGFFYPNRNLSNADALVMIYNYLNR